MNGFWNQRRTTFGILILISAFIVFFLGWTFDKDAMKRELSVSGDAIKNFRRWLDISGWTKLTYRIAYDDYENTYKDAQELAQVKSTVENVIVKNIDSRISQLWVSDYRSYTQNLDDETQIVVEIGWVADLDQAKEIIWKTVKLEFKLPNETEWTESELQERTKLAQNLYDDLSKHSDKFEEFAWNRESENITYSYISGATLEQLPTIYQDNLETLKNTETGEMSPIMSGLYHTYQYQDYSGNTQTQSLKWFTFFHLISKEQGSRESITDTDIINVAKNIWASYDDNLTLVKEPTEIAENDYIISNNTLNYNKWEIAVNQIAYDARIIAILNSNTSIEISSENDNNVAIENETGHSQIVEDAKNSLLADANAEIAGSLPIFNGGIWLTDLKKAIPSFDINNSDLVQVYEENGFTYLVVINDQKLAWEHWYNFININNVNEEEFTKELESQTFYTLEEVFVQDRLSRTNAQSSDGKLLNGANFKYASVSTSQLGQPVVVISFDDTGKETFCNITTNNIWKQMAIFIWWEMITSPVIQSKICDGSAQIDWWFTPESAKELTNQLNAGALPAPLILMQEEKVSATLWDNAFNGALYAMAIWFFVIYLYMTYLYGIKKGLISLISLAVYTLVLLAIVKIIDYALSLSWIAAIILSIWMAVDANVLIFERMKEEKANKKSDKDSIDVAYDRSRNAIRDGQISTWMIGLLLMVMWINMFKWFGTMLVVWVVLTLIINVPVIKELLHIFYKRK